MAASLVVEALLDEYNDCVSILDFVDEDELLLKPESADEFEESSTPIESFRGLLTIKLTSLSLSIVFMSEFSFDILLRFRFLVLAGMVKFTTFLCKIFNSLLFTWYCF